MIARRRLLARCAFAPLFRASGTVNYNLLAAPRRVSIQSLVADSSLAPLLRPSSVPPARSFSYRVASLSLFYTSPWPGRGRREQRERG